MVSIFYNKKPTTGSDRSHLHEFPRIAEDATP